MKKAALYIRVSTDEQARHGYSLGEQRRDLQEYATRKGYVIVGVYADEGVSARRAMSRRKELQRLLRDIEENRVDVVVIKCLDRWFRNIADFYKVWEILDAHGVEFECTQEKINTTTAAGRLELNIRLSIAQDESDRTSERIKYVFDGKRARREACTGSVPLGISIVNKKYQYNEQAEIVRYLFCEFVSGKSRKDLQRSVKERYGLSIGHRKLTLLLQNRMYLGEVRGVGGYLEPLIDYDTFRRSVEIISRFPRHTRTDRVYLFSGLISCPGCGRILSAGMSHYTAGGEPYLVYRCCRAAGDLKCSFRGCVSEKVVERYLLKTIPALAVEYIEECEAGGNRSSFEKELSVIEGKLKRLKDIYLEGIVDLGEYRSDYTELTQKKADLESRMTREVKIPQAIHSIRTDDFKEQYSVLTKVEKKRLWQSVLQRIEVIKGKPRGYRVYFL